MALGKTIKDFYKAESIYYSTKFPNFIILHKNYNFKHDSFLFDVRMAITACSVR